MQLPVCNPTSSMIRWLLKIAIVVSMFVGLPAFATKHGYLLVDNYIGKNILRYDLATGAFVDELVPEGRGGMVNPTGMTIGPDGNLYVASNTDGHPGGGVLKFNAHTGSYMGTFATVSGNSGLTEVAFGPDGNLYVSDYHNIVYRFDGTTGASMGVFASIDDAPGDQFRGIAWAPNGDLYVSYIFSGRMDRFDGHTGALVDSLTLSDTTNGAQFIAFGPDGLLYVSEYWGGGVDVYDPNTGTFVKSLLSDWLGGPNGLVFDDKGELYVNSLFSNTIVKFSGDSGSLFTQGSPLSNPQDMVITSVPEPSTYALMLGGLVILSVIVRHRKGYRV